MTDVEAVNDYSRNNNYSKDKPNTSDTYYETYMLGWGGVEKRGSRRSAQDGQGGRYNEIKMLVTDLPNGNTTLQNSLPTRKTMLQ